jgi:NAD+ kinase
MMKDPATVPPIHHVVVAVKHSTDPDGSVRARVQRFFEAQGVSCEVSLVSFVSTPGHNALTFERSPQLVVVIGGDGTFLRSARVFARQGIPMVGVNRGNLGFLTRIEVQDLEGLLERVLAGRYRLEERTMLEVVSLAGGPLALNDVVLKSAAPSQMVRLELLIDDHPVAYMDADGLVVSTPTGSTAYNLAAGGPVVCPAIDAVCITPICPHSLSVRPIVVPASQTIRVVSSGRNLHEVIGSVDGQDEIRLQPGESVSIERSALPLSIVSFDQPEDNFYQLLTQKLQWADNPRTVLKV